MCFFISSLLVNTDLFMLMCFLIWHFIYNHVFTTLYSQLQQTLPSASQVYKRVSADLFYLETVQKSLQIIHCLNKQIGSRHLYTNAIVPICQLDSCHAPDLDDLMLNNKNYLMHLSHFHSTFLILLI